MALGADRESLAVEVCNLMPNKTAVEGAIKYAEKQQRRTLVQKLSEIAEQKLEEELNQSEDEEEVQEIRETGHMSLNLRAQIEVQTNSYELKPKPMRSKEISNSKDNSDDSDSDSNIRGQQIAEEVSVDDEDSDSVSLKPKRVQIQKHSNGNPFKVTQKESIRENRRKRGRDSEESDHELDSQGFQRFYSEMKQIIREDNSDVDDEEELQTIAMRHFKELDLEERKGWAKSKKKRPKSKSENCDKDLTNKTEKYKITKFFTTN